LRGEDSCRNLHPEHERAELRLVVVQPVPLEAHDVLLRDVQVVTPGQLRDLMDDPDRCLLLLQTLDRVLGQDLVPRRLFGQGSPGPRPELPVVAYLASPFPSPVWKRSKGRLGRPLVLPRVSAATAAGPRFAFT